MSKKVNNNFWMIKVTLVVIIILIIFGLAISVSNSIDVYRKDLCPEKGYRIGGNRFSGFKCYFDPRLYEYETSQIEHPPKEVKNNE